VLATGPKVRGSKTAKDEHFSRAIKIPRTTSFGEEVQSSIPRPKFLGHVKEILRGQNSPAISSPSSSRFATRCRCWYLPESSGGRIRND
jgi:hypothetical protein